jgi:alkylation response protein AidB-like acyl-CoA dehydrogenase
MMTGGHISSQKLHEHALLEAELRRALEATSPIMLMRNALEGEGGAEPAWRAVVATGSLHFVLDARDGGLGLDWTMLAVVARELGRVLSPTAFAGAAVALRLVAEGGNETVRNRWLQLGMSGDARGCMAIVEGEGAFTEPAARLHSDRLFGSKLAVAGAEQADFAIVSCLDDGHARLVVVDLSQPGILYGPRSTLDPTRGNASLTFDGAHAEKLDLAEEKLGWSRDVLATLVAAEQLGGAERCFEIALAYAKERRAFGRAIGSFQAVKQKMVDMFQRLQLARAHVSAAAQSLCAGAAEEGVAAAAARISATDAFDFTAQEAIQIHGALGICWEHDCHLFLRRARLLALELGSALQWRRHLISSLPPKAQISDRHRDSAEHARYRAEVSTWLASHHFGPKHDRVAHADFADPQVMRAGREWQKKKAAAGYAAIDWPAELGGGGKNPIEREIYAQEERRLATPPLNLFDIGLGMCGPTLIRFATDAQKRRLVPPLVRGEEIWCQLFSEPAAGSDLAGIGTRAHRQGDHWRIEGQKVWTSYAQYADWGLLLARSDPERPKHAGLTMFFVDMRSPGITVRPLRQLAGVAEFNEVFFDGVLIPDAQRLGEANKGWATALYTLMHERSFSGVGVDVDALMTIARTRPMNGRPAIDDPAVSERCADAWVAARGLDLLSSKAFAQLARGQEPGPEFSVGKLMAGTMNQAIASLMMDIGGPAMLDAGAIDIQQDWLMSARTRLAGGSDEIMAVILGERVLGLPQEPRIDKGLAFSAIP